LTFVCGRPFVQPRYVRTLVTFWPLLVVATILSWKRPRGNRLSVRRLIRLECSRAIQPLSWRNLLSEFLQVRDEDLRRLIALIPVFSKRP